MHEIAGGETRLDRHQEVDVSAVPVSHMRGLSARMSGVATLGKSEGAPCRG
jgi:hypothetical protein